MRRSGRRPDELREVEITRGFIPHAEGSVLIRMGRTRVVCTASVEEGVPRFLMGSGRGWITAEYGMLPRSTRDRMAREAARGRGGRTYEIQRLIGRSLRAAVQLDRVGDVTVTVDCDVIEADGGTRTAAITGACVALHDAFAALRYPESPMNFLVAAVSVGIVDGEVLLDLDYVEDSNAQVDLNVVTAESGAFIEVQGTAERFPFTRDQLDEMLALAASGCERLVEVQRRALGL